MRTKLLDELRDAYMPYTVGWTKWANNKHCALNEFERYVMKIHIANDFKVSLEELVMFYNRNEVTEGLIVMLRDETQLFLYGNFLVESLNSNLYRK